jgi:creatinine amidohydrolase
MELNWNRLNWQEFEKMQKSGYCNAILPVGTVEAHGVTPLGTDNIIPETIASRLAPDLKAIIAPAVSYGITRSLLKYPGSLTVASGTFQKYLTEILMSIAMTGMKKIVIINGHGGQLDELKAAALEVFYKTEAKVAVINWWLVCHDLVEKYYDTTGGHAGVDETAAVLACAPETVHKNLYDPKMHYYVQPGANVYPNPSTILIYKEDAGDLDFDPDKANSYFDEVCAIIKSFLLDVFKRWDNGGGHKLK